MKTTYKENIQALNRHKRKPCTTIVEHHNPDSLEKSICKRVQEKIEELRKFHEETMCEWDDLIK